VAAFDKLTKAFDRQGNGDEPDSKAKGLDVVKQSLAIVRAVDKLKKQGIKITQKAQLDYILALRVLEKADVDPALLTGHGAAPPPGGNTSNGSSDGSAVRRNPKDHPEEFRKAMTHSKRVVAEVEEMFKNARDVPDKKLEEYRLCKKFLDKYTDQAVDIIKNEWLSKDK